MCIASGEGKVDTVRAWATSDFIVSPGSFTCSFTLVRYTTDNVVVFIEWCSCTGGEAINFYMQFPLGQMTIVHRTIKDCVRTLSRG